MGMRQQYLRDMKACELFELPDSLKIFEAFFSPNAHPWEWVKAISRALESFGFQNNSNVDIPAGVFLGEKVFIHPTVKLPHVATIEGPAYIGPNVEVRPGAYIRSNVIVGEGCVLGNACEFKNCLLLDKVQVPHFNYVGDSLLGNNSHLGAGVILANLRLDQKEIKIKIDDNIFDTGMRKLGAILGDGAEALCNAVLQPGTILGKKAVVMPTVAFGGYLPDGKRVLSERAVVR